jgi:hypothetical protein
VVHWQRCRTAEEAIRQNDWVIMKRILRAWNRIYAPRRPQILGASGAMVVIEV